MSTALRLLVLPVIGAAFLCLLLTAWHWFSEIGVGANYIVPLYRTGHKLFSTEFNFGDHIGVGYQFGGRRQHALMVRLQHFSNAGIEHPNPGENFVQLRYSRRL
jgi:lipid A 3-O-deacylase